MFPIRDSRTSRKFPFVNLGLIIFTIYIFVQELFAPDLDLFIANYALIPQNVNFLLLGTLKPFITSLFLHAGFLHILSNMWFLWIFGDNVEALMGHFKYFVFYIFCGVTASFVQYIFIADSSLPMIGASGAIAGVLGAYLRFFPRNTVDTLIPVFGLPFIIAVPAGFMLIYWFITQAFNGVASILVATASTGGIAYIAHTAGFSGGYLFCRYFVWSKKPV
ncbi:rhomboid family intramembrane serine protease [Candidatus Curtissbacteria bacterium]|nr:rhomboid family intramembrane serine protease [Candidatus Microgenomates bacterium]MBI2594109.1 rhomboid family intramembrane serine protease [Candidatus Curtissbacteria bacterium]